MSVDQCPLDHPLGNLPVMVQQILPSSPLSNNTAGVEAAQYGINFLIKWTSGSTVSTHPVGISHLISGWCNIVSVVMVYG